MSFSNEEKIRLSFDPNEKTEILLKALPNERALDILVRRYGLNNLGATETLESIGKRYGITRERVRQLENQAIKALRKSKEFELVADVMHELAELVEQSGGIVAEEELLDMIDIPEELKKKVLFLLHVSHIHNKHKETNEFLSHWYTDTKKADSVRNALRKLARDVMQQKHLAFPENEILERYLNYLQSLEQQIQDEKEALRHLMISKHIDKNPLGEWGYIHSPAIKVKGIKDYAYLILKKHGSPMHFTEVAKAIEDTFNRPANPATVHNELIKDDRFILVGRGMYALVEWGYTQGSIKDVIKAILEKEGPLSKEEIIDRVKRERYVKDTTISVNLQDNDLFEKTDSGLYILKASKKTNKKNK